MGINGAESSPSIVHWELSTCACGEKVNLFRRGSKSLHSRPNMTIRLAAKSEMKMIASVDGDLARVALLGGVFEVEASDVVEVGDTEDDGDALIV